MADGSITFSTKLDNKQLEKDLTRSTKKIEALEQKLAKKEADRLPIVEQMQEANLEAAEAYASVERLRKALATSQSVTAIDGKGTKDPEAYIRELERQPQIKAELAEQERLLREKEKIADRLSAQDERAVRAIQAQTAELDREKAKAGELAQQLQSGNGASAKMGQAVDRAGEYMERFTQRVQKLASRVFVFTLIAAALRKLQAWMGNVIKTNDEARAAMARLKGALLTLAQPLVEVVIPAFITLVKLLTAIIGAVAEFISLLFGTSISKSAKSAKNLYEEQNALEGVGKAAEEAAGSLAGFDEINTIQTENAGGTGGAGGGVSAGEIAPDFSWTDGITDKLKEIADLILLIGAGLALWKLSGILPGVLGTIAKMLGGILLTVGGLVLFWNGLIDAWENGVDWLNLIEMIGGLAAAVFGLYTLFGPIAAGIALVVGGLAMLVTGFRDAFQNGWNLENVLLSVSGILAAGLGIALITGSWIPALIAAIAALLLAITVATGHGQELLEGIRTILEGFVDFFTGIFTGDIEKAIGGIEKIFNGLGLAVGAVIDGIRDTFLSFLDWLDEKTGGKLHGIIEFVKGLVTGLFGFIKTTLGGTLDAVKQIFTGITQFLTGVFTNDWDMAWEGVKNIFKGVFNGIVSILEGAVNLIISGVNWLIKQMNKISFTVPDWVPGVGGKSLGLNIPSIKSISIPRLAQGAVIPPNREFLAVLGDQKSGTNIEAPLSTIKQALVEALRETGGSGGNRPIQVNVMLDKKVLARAMVSEVNDMTRQAGKPVLLF